MIREVLAVSGLAVALILMNWAVSLWWFHRLGVWLGVSPEVKESLKRINQKSDELDERIKRLR